MSTKSLTLHYGGNISLLYDSTSYTESMQTGRAEVRYQHSQTAKS